MADERTESAGLRSTVNGRLLDGAIRHSIHLRRLSSHEAARALRFLDEDLIPDLTSQAMRRLDKLRARGVSTDFTQDRFTRMIAALNAIVDEGMRTVRDELLEESHQLARMEARHQVAAIRSAMPIRVDLDVPTASLLRSVVRTRPLVLGETIPEAFTALSVSTKRRIEKQIKIGMLAGEGVDQIVRRLRGRRSVSDQSRHALAGLVRTVINAVGTQARQETYAANSNVVKAWQFVATLDTKTTLICAQNDGKTFPLGQGPMPPLHFACRSDDAPVTKSFRELGIPLDDIGPGERAAMNGRVAGDVTFPDWLKDQPLEVQIESLGRTRAGLYRRGLVSIEGFTDDHGRTLTLVQLAAKNEEVARALAV